VNQEASISEISYTWNELGIEPITSFEGDNYVFTAFDFDEVHDELVLAGNYGTSKLIYVSEIHKDVVSVELPDIPLDLFIKDGLAYVLCLNQFVVVNNKEVISNFNHKIPNVTRFDKMLVFDNKLSVLMADGSSYSLEDNSFVFSEALSTEEGIDIWIQKTSNKSFEIRSNSSAEDINIKVKYLNDIGAITFLGGNFDKHYMIVDMIRSYNPISISRVLKCSTDQCFKTLIDLPIRTFSFIKNDCKIHKDTVYTISVNKDNLILKKFKL
jgi:hypothetical protein